MISQGDASFKVKKPYVKSNYKGVWVHQLNASKGKALYSFSKCPRFPNTREP